jgi:hypothetical protein
MLRIFKHEFHICFSALSVKITKWQAVAARWNVIICILNLAPLGSKIRQDEVVFRCSVCAKNYGF